MRPNTTTLFNIVKTQINTPRLQWLVFQRSASATISHMYTHGNDTWHRYEEVVASWMWARLTDRPEAGIVTCWGLERHFHWLKKNDKKTFTCSKTALSLSFISFITKTFMFPIQFWFILSRSFLDLFLNFICKRNITKKCPFQICSGYCIKIIITNFECPRLHILYLVIFNKHKTKMWLID